MGCKTPQLGSAPSFYAKISHHGAQPSPDHYVQKAVEANVIGSYPKFTKERKWASRPVTLSIAPPFPISILGNSKLRPLRALPETLTAVCFICVLGISVSLFQSIHQHNSIYSIVSLRTESRIFAIPMAPSFIFTITKDLLFTHVSLPSYQWITERERKQIHVLGLRYSKTAF